MLNLYDGKRRKEKSSPHTHFNCSLRYSRPSCPCFIIVIAQFIYALFFVSSRLNECNHTPLQPFKFSLASPFSAIININFRVAYYFFRNSSRCSAECKMASGKRKNCRFDIGRTRQLAVTMQEVESPFSEFEQKRWKEQRRRRNSRSRKKLVNNHIC